MEKRNAKAQTTVKTATCCLLAALIGTGQGLFLVAFLLDASRRTPRDFVLLACAIAFLLLASGLASRTSWLSRAAIVLPGFMGMVLLYGLFHFLDSDRAFILVAGAAAALLCIALVFRAGPIYFLLSLACGLTLAVPLAVLAWPQFAGPLALGAFFVGGVAWLARCVVLLRNAFKRPKAKAASAMVRAVRWIFVALLFPVPGWLLGWGGGSLAVFIAAFGLQFAGLLAERWDQSTA